MNAIILLLLCQISWGDPPAKVSVRPDYSDLRAEAIRTNKALVVGIDCDPPQGNWLSCRVERVEPWSDYGHAVLVSKPSGGELWCLKALGPMTTVASVQRVLAPPVQAGTPVRYVTSTPIYQGRSASC